MLERSSGNTYAIATASHLDLATAYSVAWPVSEHISIANRAGLNGVELWPQRFGLTIELQFDMLSQREKNGIISVHQSPVGLVRNVNISQIQAAILLPELNKSLVSLERMRDQIGDVPVVLFRETLPDFMQETRFTYKQIQTDPETAAAWNVPTDDSEAAAREYIRKAKLNRFDGIVIDTHHIRRNNNLTGEKNPLGDWRKSIPILLPDCREIHIGVGRSEYPDMIEKTNEELDDLLNGGTKNTEVVEMLRFIADKGWKGLVVIEFRPSSVKKLYGRKLFLTPGDLVNSYERMRDTLYQIFDK